MGIRLKSNRSIRISVAIVGLIVLVFMTLCLLPGISRRAESDMEEWEESVEKSPEMDSYFLSRIYEGCYVLYFEKEQRQGVRTPSEIYFDLSDEGQDEEERLLSEELRDWIDGTIDNLADNFESYRSEIDYAVSIGDGQYEKNTDQPLEQVLSDTLSTEGGWALGEYYSNYFVVQFDEDGILRLDTIYSDNVSADTLIKSFGQIDRENPVWGNVAAEYWDRDIESALRKPTDFTVVFGIPRTGGYPIIVDNYGEGDNFYYLIALQSYYMVGTGALYLGMLGLITGLVFFVTGRRVWKDEISMNRPGKWYLMEAAVLGVIFAICLCDFFVQIVSDMSYMMDFPNLWSGLIHTQSFEAWANLLGLAFLIFVIYSGWYLSVRFIRPVFALGWMEYIRQYSLIYQVFPLLRKGGKKFMGLWNGFMDEMGHIDFSQRSVKTMGKFVAVNFLVLSVVSCFWFFGIGALFFYSVAMFFFLKKYYDRVGRDYRALLRGVNQIAEGNLDTEIPEDIGVFEPFKSELAKIRTGLKKAVSEEVKSQRMKTELITNVSHDLKTPLTAITTYVELLKKEDITQEERRSYIETLEKKSLRLKVLIEDLFEVSKATTNNITLNPMEMDVVNLMKQVAVEHTDAYQAAGLDLRWHVPQERVTLMLDSQKTYCIFENLFVNVQKYAMPGSRVYVDVEPLPDGTVCITIRNMSSEELNFRGDEITERFVRGDTSRNTEGSGLGLAIAKSFVEAQGGAFAIEVDGDLFKAVLRFTLWKSNAK